MAHAATQKIETRRYLVLYTGQAYERSTLISLFLTGRKRITGAKEKSTFGSDSASECSFLHHLAPSRKSPRTYTPSYTHTHASSELGRAQPGLTLNKAAIHTLGFCEYSVRGIGS